MRVKIYQINAEKDENTKRFSPFSYAEEHGGVNSDMYKQVYFGDLDADDLEGVFASLMRVINHRFIKVPAYQSVM